VNRQTTFNLCALAALLTVGLTTNCGTEEPEREAASRQAASTLAQPTEAPALEVETDWLTAAEAVSAEPASVFDAEGRQWIAYLEFEASEDEPRITLVAGVRNGDGKLELGFRSPSSLRAPAEPTLTQFGEGVYLTYEGIGDSGRGIFGRALTRDEVGIEVGPEETLASGRVLFPSVQATSADTLEVVFQALAGKQYEIRHARRSSSGEWSAPRRLFEAAGDYWRPRSATRGDGALKVVCDSVDCDPFVVD